MVVHNKLASFPLGEAVIVSVEALYGWLVAFILHFTLYLHLFLFVTLVSNLVPMFYFIFFI